MNNKITQIKVLGTGCPTCQFLHDRTLKALKELEIDDPVEYVKDIKQIIDMGLMTLPALVINDKIVIAGKIPELNELKDLITKYINQ